MITAEKRKEIIEKFKINDKDVGSSEVQVALLTTRINELTEHIRANRKDHAATRGLIKMVGRRRRLLRYIQKKSNDDYKKLIEALGIRR